ncbi:Thioesterase superfamily protein [Forsythia ovata]|uniref:Thioesterase superfamily protein n=2 Tax=Forsythia ovata TaxID=205694 RepID=A0ABD1T4G7_9LAMI
MKRLLRNSGPTMRFCSLSSQNVLKIEDILKQVRIFSNSNIIEYSKLTHDSNPLHFDLERAKNAGFADLPVPGILVASLFPQIIASHFPGAVYVKQTLEFKSPVYCGEEITGEVQASNIRQMKEKYMAKFTTKCFKDGGILVIDGEATTILPTLAMNKLEGC